MSISIKIEKIAKSRIDSVNFDDLPFGKVFADHMFIADYKNGQWQDFKIVPYGEIGMNPSISALHYGQSIFEGMKAHYCEDGSTALFRPKDNFLRMNRSAWRMCIPEIPEEIFMDGLTTLVNLDKEWIPKKKGTSLYIRPFIFATDDYLGIRPSDNYRFIIFCCPVGPYYLTPLNVKVSEDYIRAFKYGTGSAKAAGNYAAGMLPLKMAKAENFDQLIWLDGAEMKYIEESGTMNLFFVVNGVVITPKAGGTILEGVTRDSIIKICRKRNIPVEIRDIEIEEIANAYSTGTLTEAFGAGTAATVAPIQTITYNNNRMILQDVSENKYSKLFFDELEGIKHKSLEDPFNWTYTL